MELGVEDKLFWRDGFGLSVTDFNPYTIKLENMLNLLISFHTFRGLRV